MSARTGTALPDQVPTWNYLARRGGRAVAAARRERAGAIARRLSAPRTRRGSRPNRAWTRAKMAPGRFEAMLKAIARLRAGDRGAARDEQARPAQAGPGRGGGRGAGAVQPRNGGADARGGKGEGNDSRTAAGSPVAQPLHPDQPGADRRDDRRACSGCCSGRATSSSRADRGSAFRSRSSASSPASSPPNIWRTSGGRRPSREAFLPVGGRRRGRAHPARRPAGEDARPPRRSRPRPPRSPRRSPTNGTRRATLSSRARCR